MSKHDSAPTHGWVIGSQINKWLALVFVIIIFMLIAETLWIASAIKRDCTEPYKIRKIIGGSWIVMYAGSHKDGCADPY